MAVRHHIKVLVVDDEVALTRSLRRGLEAEGFAVDVAHDGEEALAAIEADPPDLVLLDVMIPRRDGYDVCQTIRANPEWSGGRVIMLTAKGREVEREKGMAMGADDYVTKPFSTRELTDRVKALLEADAL